MRNREEAGFTLIEVLVVIAILATIAGMVAILIPPAQEKQKRMVCTENIRGLTGLLESAQAHGYPRHSGPNLLLYLVVKGEMAGPDSLGKLFCPGDEHESFDDAGGEAAYADIDLTRQGEFGHLTSYAGRAQADAACRTGKGNPRPQVLVCDDSADHHRGGLIVGLTGGAVKFRDQMDFYKLDSKAEIVVGEGSQVPELTCMRPE